MKNKVFMHVRFWSRRAVIKYGCISSKYCYKIGCMSIFTIYWPTFSKICTKTSLSFFFAHSRHAQVGHALWLWFLMHQIFLRSSFHKKIYQVIIVKRALVLDDYHILSQEHYDRVVRYIKNKLFDAFFLASEFYRGLLKLSS